MAGKTAWTAWLDGEIDDEELVLAEEREHEAEEAAADLAQAETEPDELRGQQIAAALVIADLVKDGAPTVIWHIGDGRDREEFPILEGQVSADADDPMATVRAYAAWWGAEIRDRFADYPPCAGEVFEAVTELRGIHARVWARLKYCAD